MKNVGYGRHHLNFGGQGSDDHRPIESSFKGELFFCILLDRWTVNKPGIVLGTARSQRSNAVTLNKHFIGRFVTGHGVTILYEEAIERSAVFQQSLSVSL